MAKGGYDKERAARVLVDAISLGDRTAADRHQVSEKTIQRYRARLREDPALSQLVQAKGREAEHGWHFARARFLRRALEKLEALIETATLDNIKDVTEALKAVGELEIAREALGVSVGDRREGATPAANAGGDAPEADD